MISNTEHFEYISILLQKTNNKQTNKKQINKTKQKQNKKTNKQKKTADLVTKLSIDLFIFTTPTSSQKYQLLRPSTPQKSKRV